MGQKKKWYACGILTGSIAVIMAGLILWTQGTEKNACTRSLIGPQPLDSYLCRQTFTETDYSFLCQQTGLFPPAIDALWAQGELASLLGYQKAYFCNPSYLCEANTIISREERLTEPGGRICLPALEDGDILITFNCHVFGWRSGHAALVVDAEQGLTLEARVLGTDSAVLSIGHWEEYPSFTVLRLKGTNTVQRAEIASYAREYLVGIPYRVTAGLFAAPAAAFPSEGALCPEEAMLPPELFPPAAESVSSQHLAVTPPAGTHCAHLVWYAFRFFGYDLDSDGGRIVTPRDIYDSPLLEPIQTYGNPYS